MRRLFNWTHFAVRCVCSRGWTGDDCKARVCNMDCGAHGRCENNACVCEAGWAGPFCRDRACDPRCSMHGQVFFSNHF